MNVWDGSKEVKIFDTLKMELKKIKIVKVFLHYPLLINLLMIMILFIFLILIHILIQIFNHIFYLFKVTQRSELFADAKHCVKL